MQDRTPYMVRAKFERLKRDWTQADLLARAQSLDYHTLRLLEQGRATPTDEQLAELGRVFKISPASVLLKPTLVRDPEEVDAEQVAS